MAMTETNARRLYYLVNSLQEMADSYEEIKDHKQMLNTFINMAIMVDKEELVVATLFGEMNAFINKQVDSYFENNKNVRVRISNDIEELKVTLTDKALGIYPMKQAIEIKEFVRENLKQLGCEV